MNIKGVNKNEMVDIEHLIFLIFEVVKLRWQKIPEERKIDLPCIERYLSLCNRVKEERRSEVKISLEVGEPTY